MSGFLLWFMFIQSEIFPLFFDNCGSFWLIGHFEMLICLKVCSFNSTKIIFTILLIHQHIRTQDFGTFLFLLLVIQTK